MKRLTVANLPRESPHCEVGVVSKLIAFFDHVMQIADIADFPVAAQWQCTATVRQKKLVSGPASNEARVRLVLYVHMQEVS